MIDFLAGKPGNGKSLFGANCALEELRRSNRAIVTNLALRLKPWVDGGGVPRKGLLRFLEDKYGETFDAERRILLLDDDQVKRFYAYRVRIPSNDWEEREVRVIPAAEDQRFHFTPDYGGCRYIVDEAHEHFGAREWMKTGKEVLSWASQHRRAGDDCTMITQVVGNVEKQLRGVSQECTVLVNHGYRVSGVWRQPNVISLRVYATTPPGPQEAPMRYSTIKFRREDIYHCYDTASGVGVVGKGADIGKRARGLHWATLPAAVVLVGVGSVFGLKGCIAAAKHTNPLGLAPAAARAVPSVEVPVSGSMEVKKEVKEVTSMVRKSEVVWCSLAQLGPNKLFLGLSDGRVLYFPQDKGITEMTDSYLIYRGVRYERRSL